MKKIIFSYDQLQKIAQSLMEQFNNCRIVTFSGPLGAGKTTLIRELLHLYGVKEEITSPTFTYVNVYQNIEGKIFYHFDLYRIKSIDEFLIAGFDEYLVSDNSLCLIEWPEVIEPLLKIKHEKPYRLILDYAEEKNKRILEIMK